MGGKCQVRQGALFSPAVGETEYDWEPGDGGTVHRAQDSARVAAIADVCEKRQRRKQQFFLYPETGGKAQSFLKPLRNSNEEKAQVPLCRAKIKSESDQAMREDSWTC